MKILRFFVIFVLICFLFLELFCDPGNSYPFISYNENPNYYDDSSLLNLIKENFDEFPNQTNQREIIEYLWQNLRSDFWQNVRDFLQNKDLLGLKIIFLASLTDENFIRNLNEDKKREFLTEIAALDQVGFEDEKISFFYSELSVILSVWDTYCFCLKESNLQPDDLRDILNYIVNS